MSKFTKVAVLLAVFAVLFCIFSCGSEEEKAKAVLSKEKHIPIPKECDSLYPKGDTIYYDLSEFSKDTAAFMECYNKYNGNREIKCEESEFNEYSVCAVIHPKIFGFPRECLNFVGQKDSLAYYACCKKYNACWGRVTSGDGIYTKKQLGPEWINLDKIHSIEDYKENPEIGRKNVLEIPWVKARMDSICGGKNVKHENPKDSIVCSVLGY